MNDERGTMNDDTPLVKPAAEKPVKLPPFIAHRSSFRASHSPPGRRAGFTLMEVLMVVVIALIASAMAIPRFARSYKGAKLRTSLRSVVMASRHARATAVLQQKHMAILFDGAQGQFEIVTVGSGAGASARNRFLEERATPSFSDEEGESEAAPLPSVTSDMVKRLAEGIRITHVDMGDAEQEYDGIFWVNYYPNGMCDKYIVHLEDDDNVRAFMEVDPITGSTSVEYDN